MKPNILRRAMLAGAIATSSMIGITAATPHTLSSVGSSMTRPIMRRTC